MSTYPQDYQKSYNTINNNDIPTLQYSVQKSKKSLACLKCFFVFINIFVAIIGLILIGLGVTGFLYLKTLFAITDMEGVYIPIIFLVVGVFLVCITISSCFCDPRSNFFGLYTYSFVQLLCFIVIVVGIAMFFNQKDFIENSFENGFRQTVYNYTLNEQEVDFIQNSLECCGSTNYSDYFHTYWPKNATFHVPESCCIYSYAYPKTCDTKIVPNKKNYEIYDKGCSEAMNDFINDNFMVIIGFGVAFSVIPLLSCFISCCLLHAGKKGNLRLEYQLIEK